MLRCVVVLEKRIPAANGNAVEIDPQWVRLSEQEPPEGHREVAIEGCYGLEEALVGGAVSDFCISLNEVAG